MLIAYPKNSKIIEYYSDKNEKILQKILINLIILIIICVGGFQKNVFAESLKSTQAYFEDPLGQLSFAEIQQKTFTPFDQTLVKGHSSSIFWIRVQYTRSVGLTEPLFLRVLPTFLDSVCIYQYNAAPINGYHVHCAGDALPFNQRQWKKVTPFFTIQSTKKSNLFYIRLQSTSTILMQAELVTQEEALKKDIDYAMIFGVHLGIIFVLLLWGFFLLAVDRNWVAVIFILYQILMFLLITLRSGYLVLFLQNTATTTDDLYATLVLANILCVILLNRLFFSQFVIAHWQKKILDFFIVSLIFHIFLYLFGYYRVVTVRNGTIIGIVSIFAFVWIIVSLYKTKQVNLAFIKRYSVLLSFVGFLGILRLGFLNLNNFELQSLSPLAIATIPFVLFIIQSQRKTLSCQNKKLEMEMILMYQEKALEQRQRRQQSAFMAMLTHELKLPLSVVNMIFGSKKFIETGNISSKNIDHIKMAMRDMRHLIEQCIYVDKLLEYKQELPLKTILLFPFLESLLQHFLEKKRIFLDCDNKLRTQGIYTSEIGLNVILKNLLDNSLKYSPEESPVIFTVYLEERKHVPIGLCITVSNTVESIHPEEIRLFFEKYYRAPNVKHLRGTGLGLWLSRELAHRLQGKLTCSFHDQQIIFHLFLPFFSDNE